MVGAQSSHCKGFQMLVKETKSLGFLTSSSSFKGYALGETLVLQSVEGFAQPYQWASNFFLCWRGPYLWIVSRSYWSTAGIQHKRRKKMPKPWQQTLGNKEVTPAMKQILGYAVLGDCWSWSQRSWLYLNLCNGGWCQDLSPFLSTKLSRFLIWKSLRA